MCYRKDNPGGRQSAADARLNGPVAIGERIGDLDCDLVQAGRAGRERRAIDNGLYVADRHGWGGCRRIAAAGGHRNAQLALAAMWDRIRLPTGQGFRPALPQRWSRPRKCPPSPRNYSLDASPPPGCLAIGRTPDRQEFAVVAKLALVPPGVVTVTVTGPAGRSGASTLS